MTKKSTKHCHSLEKGSPGRKRNWILAGVYPPWTGEDDKRKGFTLLDKFTIHNYGSFLCEMTKNKE